MIDNNQNENNNMPSTDSTFQNNESSLSELRNIIVGSFAHKGYYLQNGVYQQLLSSYLNSQNNIPILNLQISIIDSYIISNSKLSTVYPEKIKELSISYINLSNVTLKRLSTTPLNKDTQSLYENSFRLLANLKQENLFNVDQSFTNFISNIDQYLINDVLLQSICVILSKICENSYYVHLITSNEKLLQKLIDKFFANTGNNVNINMNKALVKVLVSLTEEDENFSDFLLNEKNVYPFITILNKGIRNFDVELKILYIKLMTNIIIESKASEAKKLVLNEPIVKWSVSILIDLIGNKEVMSLNHKISCINALSKLLKQSIDFQNTFYNINGIELLFKELHSLYSENQLKEIDDKVKALKANKTKNANSDKIFLLEKDEDAIISNDSSLDINTEYKRSLIECLSCSSSLKEESRKKIIDSKEIKIILNILSDPSNPSKLILSCALLVLSLSRGHLTIKKVLLDYDITSLLFKLSSHSNVDIQIQTTNSLCNFLLNNSTQIGEVVECISRLLKIFKATTHKKIRFNSVCAMKNIIFSVNSNRDIKKNIMKKITYDTLLSLLDDQDIAIQEQALLIFRVLLYKSFEDIEEVFSHCKDKLLSNILKKLNDKSSSNDIIVHSLYILSNISSGNNKQKSVIDKSFLERILYYAGSKVTNIRLVCMIILNNLLTAQEIQKSIIKIEGILPLLEKIAFEDNSNMEDVVMKEGNESTNEDSVEAKQLAMGMIGIIKNVKKEK